jgi:hypothetical protein
MAQRTKQPELTTAQVKKAHGAKRPVGGGKEYAGVMY